MQVPLEWLSGLAACEGNQSVFFCGDVTVGWTELCDRSQVVLTGWSTVMALPDAVGGWTH